MMEHKITPRQLEALEASYRFRNPHTRVGGPIGERKGFMDGMRTRAGGSAGRMVEELMSRGFVTKNELREPENDRDEWGHLTVKGYEALIPHATKLGIDEQELRSRMEARRGVEAARACRKAEEKAERGRIAEQRRLREREKRAGKLRALFNESELGQEFVSGLDTDDELLDFAERVGDIMML